MAKDATFAWGTAAKFLFSLFCRYSINIFLVIDSISRHVPKRSCFVAFLLGPWLHQAGISATSSVSGAEHENPEQTHEPVAQGVIKCRWI